MSITVQTALEFLADLQAYLKSLEPDLNVSNDTEIGARLQSLAEACAAQSVNASAIEANIFPQTCDSTSLELHAEARLGTGARKSATKSSGIITISGTIGSTASAGDTLTHAEGATFQLTEDITLSATTGTVEVESTSTGESSNLAVGETLTFDSPASGINSTATISTACSGGEDQESDDELRERLINAWQNPLAGGRASDYWQWAMSIEGVGSAYVYCPSSSYPTGRSGLGTVDVAILDTGTGSARQPSDDLVEEVQDYIDSVRPCCVKSVYVRKPVAQEVDVDVAITAASSAYDFDWAYDGSYPLVVTWDSGSRKIVTNRAALPTTFDDYFDDNGYVRIWLNGEVCTVIDTGTDGGTGDKYIILSEDPATAPTTSDTIYPAGPLSEPVDTAIKEYFDRLGPARGRGEDPNQVGWVDSVYIGALYHAIYSVDGVRMATLDDPTTTQSPTTDGGGATLYFLTYGDLVIKRTT